MGLCLEAVWSAKEQPAGWQSLDSPRLAQDTGPQTDLCMEPPSYGWVGVQLTGHLTFQCRDPARFRFPDLAQSSSGSSIRPGVLTLAVIDHSAPVHIPV
jgi:hypothetical protein